MEKETEIPKISLSELINIYLMPAYDIDNTMVLDLWKTVELCKKAYEDNRSEDEVEKIITISGWAAAALGRYISCNSTVEIFDSHMQKYAEMRKTYNKEGELMNDYIKSCNEFRDPVVSYLMQKHDLQKDEAEIIAHCSLSFDINTIKEKRLIEPEIVDDLDKCEFCKNDIYVKYQNLLQMLDEMRKSWPIGYAGKGLLPFGPLLAMIGDTGGGYQNFVLQGMIMGLCEFLEKNRESEPKTDFQTKQNNDDLSDEIDESITAYAKKLDQFKMYMTNFQKSKFFEVRVPDTINDSTYADVLLSILKAVDSKQEYADINQLIATAKKEISGNIMRLLYCFPLRLIYDKNHEVNGFYKFEPFKYQLWTQYSPPEKTGKVHRRYFELLDISLPNSTGMNVNLFTRTNAAIPTLYHEYQHFLGNNNEASVHLKSYLFSKRFYSQYSPELAAFDGAFLSLHQMLGKKIIDDMAVYALNDKIESYYGNEIDEEGAKEYTDTYLKNINRMVIDSNNRSLTWCPEIKWERLTDDEDKVNADRLRRILMRHYTSKNSISRNEFLQILSEYNVNIISREENEIELNQDEIQQAQEARKRLDQEGLFGNMIQDNKKNKQPISWIKIGDIRKNTLYVSKEVLAVRRFHGENKNVNWMNSELREWLNTYLIKKIFTKAERSLLQPKISGLFGLIQRKAKELDRMFLLSIDDIANIENLETNDIESIMIPAAPILHPVYGTMTASRKQSHNVWWLSSTAKNPEHAITVFYDGTINKQGYHKYNAYCGVRPAILVPKWDGQTK
jgi:hypothetical protein